MRWNPKISLFRVAQTNCVQVIATFEVAIGDFAYLLLYFLPQTLKSRSFPPPCGFPHLIPIFRSCLDKATNMTYPPSSFAPIRVMIMWGPPQKILHHHHMFHSTAIHYGYPQFCDTQTPSCYRLKSPIFVCWYSHIMWGWIKTHIAIWPGRWTSHPISFGVSSWVLIGFWHIAIYS